MLWVNNSNRNRNETEPLGMGGSGMESVTGNILTCLAFFRVLERVLEKCYCESCGEISCLKLFINLYYIILHS